MDEYIRVCSRHLYTGLVRVAASKLELCGNALNISREVMLSVVCQGN